MSDQPVQPGYSPLPMFQLFNDFWYKFVYFPTTNWQRAYNPQFFFGCNTDDVEIEHHVLNEVGSYGHQLGRILDMLDVLVARLPQHELSPLEQVIVQRFRNLSRDVDHAVADYRGLPDQGVTLRDIQKLIIQLKTLESTDAAAYRHYVQLLWSAIEPDPVPMLPEQSSSETN